jgi:hypothetical protein
VVRHDDDTFRVTDDPVARIDRDLAAGDPDVDIDGVVVNEIGRGRRDAEVPEVRALETARAACGY